MTNDGNGPQVTLLASTTLTPHAHGPLGLLGQDGSTHDADHLAEVAGRACYQSWSRPNPKTAANPDYLAHVIEIGHESVLAHASATFYIEGVSRSLTHELIRHRWLAFSELSQRYVNAEDFELVYPPAADEYERIRLKATFAAAIGAYRTATARYESSGMSRKEARQAARAHLPLCTETKIVVSGNMRAWRDFMRLRLSPHADAEIQRLAVTLLAELQSVAPASFADFSADGAATS